jgi:alkylation response protein AidB-like acyl-CoA dehydrogenase
MDFDLTATQQAVADVVTSALDRDNSWSALVEGGVTALPVPERLGGDGVGLPEVATALTEVGRHGAVTPALATLGLGVVPLLDLASDEQQDRFLAGVAKGGVLTAALNEPGAALAERPATTFVGGRLSGTKIGVPYAEQAEWMIVTADSAVVVLSPKANGVRLVRTPTSNDSDEYTMTFSDVAVGASGQSAGAGHDRRIRRRAGGRSAAVDGRLRGEPETVRQTAVDLPDRGRAAVRGLHRFAHYRSGREIGGLAAIGGA